MTAPRLPTTRRRRLSLALSVVALAQPTLIMAVTSSTHAKVARHSAPTTSATRVKQVHCGNDHIARHGTYDVWAHAFRQARTSSYLAG